MRFFKPFDPPIPPEFPKKYYNILDFGAVNSDAVKSTKAFADAIDTCSKNGGGHVVVPEGNWLCGAIHLKDNVDLHLEEGAYVHFSADFEDYLPVVFGILGGNRCYSPSHFIYAYRCKNVAVSGKGVFDGHGENWWSMKKNQPGMRDLMVKGANGVPVEERVYDKREDGVRPRMLQFVECENVLIEGVTFKNSPSWTIHPAWCYNITVKDITVRNPFDAPNTDGVNFESCKRGLIDGIDVETGDDACCLKAGRDRDAWDVGIPCEDIEIRNCKVSAGHGGFTIGSETSACIKNAYIHDCVYTGTLYSAVRIKTMKGRGGYVENIDIENISAQNCTDSVIYVTMRYTGEPLDDQSKPPENMPELRNISVSGISGNSCGYGFKIIGENGFDIKNFYFSDINITSESGFVAENVTGLNMENVNITNKKI